MTRWIILSSCFFLFFYGAGSGWSAENSLDLSLTTREMYNDNIFYDAENPTNDMITTLAPAIDVGRRSERFMASASASLLFRHYRESKGLNATDQFYQGDIGIGISERFTVSADAEYSQDSRRDRDVMETGILFSNAVRDQWTVGVGGQYLLSEKSSVQLSAGFHDEVFKDDPDDEYDDFRYYQAGMLFSRYITDTVTAVAQAGYATYEYPDQDVENWSGTLGVDWQMTETVSGFLNIGTRRTTFIYLIYSYGFDSSTFDIYLVPEEKETKKSGYVGSMGGTWKGEKGAFSLTAEHDLQATSGANGTTQRTGVSLSYTRRWAENFSARVTGHFHYNHSDDDMYASEVIDERSLYLEEGLQYQPVDWLSLSGGYRYAWFDDRTDRKKIQNNTAWVALKLKLELID